MAAATSAESTSRTSASTKIESDVNLKDGEANILGGLIERDVIKNLNGIPGTSEIPVFRYLSSDISHEVKDDEVMIIITPHVIRFPSITADNLRPIAAGTDTNARVYRESANPTGGCWSASYSNWFPPGAADESDSRVLLRRRNCILIRRLRP